MSPKEKLYFLLKEFINRTYDLKSLCKFASTISNLELPHEKLNSTEKEVFNELCEALNRFSPYESDLKLGGFVSISEIEKIINEIVKKLNIQSDKSTERSLNSSIRIMLIKLSEGLIVPHDAAQWAANILLSNSEIKKDKMTFGTLNLIAKSDSELENGFPLYTEADFKAWLNDFEAEKKRYN